MKKNMKKLFDYIKLLQDQSFEGWSEEEKNGYRTALFSIKEKIIELNSISLLEGAGCDCEKPLLGERPGVGLRCLLCNTVADNKHFGGVT